MIKTLEDFLDSPLRNVWLNDRSNHTSVYVRKGHHVVDDQMIVVLDVANASVAEKFRGRGIFTRWLDHAEAVVARSDLEGIRAENVLDPHAYSFYINRGYRDITRNAYMEGPKTFFKYLT